MISLQWREGAQVSEYLLSFYRPIADELLAQHGLVVPEGTRDMLATTIMHSRELPNDEAPRSRSPNPAKVKVQTHALALLAYAENPPARKSSIPKRCASLRKALLSSDLLAFELGIIHADHGAYFDFGALLDSLEAEQLDPAAITGLLKAMSHTPSGNWGELGRPSGLAKSIVRTACIAWDKAGRAESFTWNTHEDALTGPLPAFLRDLIACCNGSHQAIQALYRHPAGQVARGDSLKPSDGALRELIVESKKGGLF